MRWWPVPGSRSRCRRSRSRTRRRPSAPVGRVEVEPNSPNVIPGVVRMTVDLRHHDDATLAAMEAEMYAAIARVAAAEKVQIETKKLHDIAAVRFHPDCVAAVRAAAAGLGHAHRDIISGAGHDAVHMSRITPSAMIFVPCKDGLSHNEAESATLRALRRRRPGAAGGGADAGREAGRALKGYAANSMTLRTTLPAFMLAKP